MKLTDTQIREIMHSAGITRDVAIKLVGAVAAMCAERIRGELMASDPTGLQDGDSHAAGMERAAALLDSE